MENEKPKDRSEAPSHGRNDDAPIYYQPESGQPGTTRDPVPGAPEPGARKKEEEEEDPLGD